MAKPLPISGRATKKDRFIAASLIGYYRANVSCISADVTASYLTKVGTNTWDNKKKSSLQALNRLKVSTRTTATKIHV